MPIEWHTLENPSGVLKDSIHVAARRVIRLFHFFSRAADDGGQEAQVVYGLYFDSFAIGVQPPKFILSLTYSLFNCLID